MRNLHEERESPLDPSIHPKGKFDTAAVRQACHREAKDLKHNSRERNIKHPTSGGVPFWIGRDNVDSGRGGAKWLD